MIRWLPAALLASPLLAAAVPASGAAPAAAPAAARTVHDFRVTDIDGAPVSLAVYRGKALLVVNTASRCGYTPQYRSLEELYQKYRARGFEVLAFPANNFMNQEPGSNAEIRQFCSKKYATTFPLFAKISVRGKYIAPLYRYLTKESGFPGDIEWNFTKFLVGPDGRVVARFGSGTDPLSPKVTAKLEATLPRAAPGPPAPAR
jgi:glutathione peroxidase